MGPQRLLAHPSAVCARAALACSHFAPDDMDRHLAPPCSIGGQYVRLVVHHRHSISVRHAGPAGMRQRRCYRAATVSCEPLGMGTGVAVCQQAMGAGRYMEVGLLAQRGTVCCLVVSLPIWALWWNITPLLELAGQPPDAVAYAARSVSRPRKHRIILASAPAHRQYPGRRPRSWHAMLGTCACCPRGSPL